MAVFGTLEYAPPEQRGYARHFGKPSARSDIFAFGKTMYRLLTGEIPFAVEHEPLEHAPAWYQLLSDCVRQNPEKRPESAGVLVSRLKGIGKEPLRKEKLARERAERQAKERNRNAQQQTREKQPIGWQELKPTLIVLALIGLGGIFTAFLANLFQSRNISFLGKYGDDESGAIVGLLLSILLVGQYLWRHRQTMPHLAMTFGLIGVGFAIWFISVAIFVSLNISFLGDDRGASGIIVGLLLSILLVGQYLWRHRQTISRSAVITGILGILGIAIWPFFILFMIFF
ncbi:hypothetical protein PN36_30065 [Candidatus Thiomargarita nelsonii]|uniref:Protein kinase domain-containing protein n=1 Tax=Candidatus Thiomargarita nelsonii TaxID=1003181 RepID=A0A4E0QLI4_9GAMM|nr:hypothetical protein PN36_30065 [Candidatus Thiomargarita nelsonii]